MQEVPALPARGGGGDLLPFSGHVDRELDDGPRRGAAEDGGPAASDRRLAAAPSQLAAAALQLAAAAAPLPAWWRQRPSLLGDGGGPPRVQMRRRPSLSR